MPRHRFQHVRFAPGMRPSALLLDKALIQAGCAGSTIEWGKRRYTAHSALLRMREVGVSVPEVYSPREANSLMDEQGGQAEWPDCVQVIGRTENHRAGSGFWFCTDKFQVNAAADQGATHFLRYIPNAREFRVHIVDGKSIKLTEKKLHVIYHGGSSYRQGDHDFAQNDIVRSRERGWHQVAPGPDAHRKTLRAQAKKACAAINAPFGAVDILLQGATTYVLEVNTAPALTDPNTTTLAKYVSALTRRTD